MSNIVDITGIAMSTGMVMMHLRGFTRFSHLPCFLFFHITNTTSHKANARPALSLPYDEHTSWVNFLNTDPILKYRTLTMANSEFLDEENNDSPFSSPLQGEKCT